MWTKTNYKGETETWYSEKDIQEMTCPNCGEKLLNPTGAELYDKVLDYKQALEKIKEVTTLDNINCKISRETQNVCNDVLKIINEVQNG